MFLQLLKKDDQIDKKDKNEVFYPESEKKQRRLEFKKKKNDAKERQKLLNKLESLRQDIEGNYCSLFLNF